MENFSSFFRIDIWRSVSKNAAATLFFFPIFLFRGVLLGGWLRCERMGLKKWFSTAGRYRRGTNWFSGALGRTFRWGSVTPRHWREEDKKCRIEKKTDGTDRSCYTAVLIFLSLSVLVCRTTFITFIIPSRSTTFRVLSIRDFVWQRKQHSTPSFITRTQCQLE